MSNKKLNEGCLKIFKFLELLYEDKAYYKDVIEIFKDDLNEDQTKNSIQVILNKYSNTFKVFGMKLVKEKNKFRLGSSLYTMKFSMDDLKSMNILFSSIQDFPDETLAESMLEFLNSITFRMNTDDKISLDTIRQTNNYSFPFQYLELKSQIKHCLDLCKSNQLVNLIYYKRKKEFKVRCKPKDVIYNSKNVYFAVHDVKTMQNLEIPLGKILRIEVNHQVASSSEITQTVVYKLSDRLAKTYKPKQGEESQGLDEQGRLTIINRGEPIEKLFKRLMRYSSSCEIVRPKFIRDEFIELINKTLNNYEEM
ncbi:MAG: hypothetical protein NC191_05620 [Muribaculaceae bacterium]|nr:hypothetical protein [Muribaculaceae bacterium]